ncbi:MAG: leucine-rich repeat protein [Bacilli bacterium]|nr:leucine-rich repeat protein [Bacilli bacterium]
MKLLKRIFIILMILTSILLIKPISKVEAESESTGSVGLQYTLNSGGASYAVTGIGTCTDTNVVIPNEYNGLPVTSIEANAFKHCKDIITVEIPENIVEIGDDAFYSCLKLKDLIIEGNNNSMTIGSYAFYYCRVLNNVYFKGTVEEWCKISFKDSYSNPMNYTSNFYMLNEKGEYKKVTKLEIPSTVTSIGNYQFAGLYDLREVIIPNTVTSIGDSAFAGCYSLTSIEIPESITKISDYAFSSCYIYNLVNNSNLGISIGSSNYGNIAHYTIKLTNKDGSVKQKNGVMEYIEKDGFVFIKEKEVYKLINYVGSEETVTLPLDINGNKYTIFQMRGVKNLIIPEGFTEINDYAFYDCSTLESVKIPTSVTRIGNYAFNGCKNLTELFIPNSVENLGSSAFSYCNNLNKVIFEENSKITYFSDRLFEGSKNLIEISIPKGVTDIYGLYSYCFSTCFGLESIEIPSSVKYIGGQAFNYCVSLTNVYYQGTIEDWCNIYFDSGMFSTPMQWATHFYMLDENNDYYEVTEIFIPDTINRIKNCQFYGFTNLEKIYIPKSVTYIGDDALYFGSNSTIYCESSSKPSEWSTNWNRRNYPVVWNSCMHRSCEWIVESEQSCTEAGYKYKKCSICNLIVEENNAPALGHNYNENNKCTNCGDVKISEGLEYRYDKETNTYSVKGIGTCTDSVIVIPSVYNELPVTEIFECAFMNMTNIKKVILPETITHISLWAFDNCQGLESIVLPKSLENISDSAFRDCLNLKNVYYNGTIEDWCNIVLEDTPMNNGEFFYMLNEEGEYYEVTEIVIPDGITSIGLNQFYSFDNITKVTIPNGVTDIKINAFAKCKNLISVNVPNSVTYLGDYAFSECTSLKNIDLPNSIKSMGANVFSLSTSLEQIEIPTGLEKITMGTFAGCTSLTSVVIPDNIYKIGTAAFSGCTGLTNVEISGKTEEIEDSVFLQCTSLAKIVIPFSVRIIGRYAFSECENLTIYCEAKSKLVGWDEKWNASNCPVVWSYCLHNLSDWTIDLEPTCALVGHKYKTCTKCNNVVEEAEIEKVDHNFDELNKCEVCGDYKEHVGLNYTINASSDGYILTSLGTCTDTVINIPSMYNGLPVVEIGNNAFEYSSVTLINIPNSVVKIGDYVFHASKNLEQVLVDTENEYYVSVDGILFDKAITELIVYPAKKTGSEYNIPNTVTNIKDSAFAYNGQLTKITIPESVKTITDYAFYRCILLIEIIIPNSVESIGSNAFGECQNLEKITFKENSKITEIADWSFYNCKKLTSFEIPENVTKIGVNAFGNCSSLIEIIIVIKITIIKNNAFSNCKNLKILCEAEMQPSGFESNWNKSGCETVWGYCEHIISDWIIDKKATCKEQGHKYQECTKCHDVLNEEKISILDHTYDQYVVADKYLASKADCLNKAKYYFSCVCGEKGTTTFNYGELGEHNYVDRKCTVCNIDEYTLGDVDNNGNISTSDVTYLLYHLMFGEAMYPVNQPVDYNNDGLTNTNDVIYLLYHIMFGETQYPLYLPKTNSFEIKDEEEE